MQYYLISFLGAIFFVRSLRAYDRLSNVDYEELRYGNPIRTFYKEFSISSICFLILFYLIINDSLVEGKSHSQNSKSLEYSERLYSSDKIEQIASSNTRLPETFLSIISDVLSNLSFVLITIVLAISLFATLFAIIFPKIQNTVTKLATISIGVTVIGVLLNIETLNLERLEILGGNLVENRTFNFYTTDDVEKGVSIEKITPIAEITGFNSGSSALPKHDWSKTIQRLNEDDVSIILVSGFTDPHKMLNTSDTTNKGLALNRATSVSKELKNKYSITKPIFILHNALETGVKLKEHQIKNYAIERKVIVYIGTKKSS
ncbi:hypothetical protein [Vibrio splendidus]|uniref:hypothetical protein n=1 Tax=Vibrio splendidus TaxID=29497 RepID=UPI00006715DA|nr:hypothetical protein [Vibrio splendidus]EAP94829.1 hypothetical protein V12B01_04108 [Vibrio splendidus 12B01]